jgi:5-methylcytosine-specific restriction endonuclease McrA
LAAPEGLTCFLCGRAIGTKVEWHHPVPRSRGGRHTEPVHPICHRAIHATFTNKELERTFSSADALRAHPDIRAFLRFVETKDPDFHVPTRRRRD